jgi:DNA replication protein DnaC
MHLYVEKGLLWKLCVARHLILDDVGAAFDNSGWFTSILYSIVDKRMNASLPTWAAMNDAKTVDARVLRRLTENNLVVQLKGDE